ncbi:MAG: type II toxin-antitoxin system Phd/YefM family antitoxin [Candidatus Omnitrophica bacterium]|nr:type II toxin-antitoxin system Phd/YefM family antitoxin [Candidatus Omnitrophota bacterium]MCA9436103.1 type II toxin-antitoxin system Phd/YefM family antitoxin [Candidatus Omnitrophota bacterium]MCA9439250.1 type II toxin-antitoxin system Phd/YefM family antitoxin [Candidatus Omnitrophota bacterium]MCA9448448.1 type II toxin-antitoxin system Phd/YefM family antitoxin [Candidatus Omnitrophota bacterium]
MIDIAKDILSLSDFKRRSSELLKRMKKSHQPLVLTVNGRAELVVQDAKTYQSMLERMERAEAIAGIERGLTEMGAGKGSTLEEFDKKMRKKYKIPKSGQ